MIIFQVIATICLVFATASLGLATFYTFDPIIGPEQTALLICFEMLAFLFLANRWSRIKMSKL